MLLPSEAVLEDALVMALRGSAAARASMRIEGAAVDSELEASGASSGVATCGVDHSPNMRDWIERQRLEYIYTFSWIVQVMRLGNTASPGHRHCGASAAALVAG